MSGSAGPAGAQQEWEPVVSSLRSILAQDGV
ncbi:hypothetical protein M2253_001010 [Leucobacter luti]|nr:hypothetical protein [Leucobacter luti]